MFAHFSLRGAPPRADPTSLAKCSASGTPPPSSRSHTAGPVRVPNALARWVLPTDMAIGVLGVRPALHVNLRREAPWQWHCNSCGMRMDHACRQAGNAMLAYRSRKDVAKLGPRVHQSIIHLMLVGGGGNRCWTS